MKDVPCFSSFRTEQVGENSNRGMITALVTVAVTLFQIDTKMKVSITRHAEWATNLNPSTPTMMITFKSIVNMVIL
jgi:hypothetical protein